MCLELFNPSLGLPFAWLGLALFAVLVAALAALFLLNFVKNNAKNRPSPGFTCPCYAPPYIPTENKQ
jgi:hypothetical protein